MKLLSEILYKVRIEEVIGSTHVAISSVTFDSRKAKKDALFIATRGTAADGHKFIEASVAAGSVAVLCEEMPENKADNVTYVKVADTSYAPAARCV